MTVRTLNAWVERHYRDRLSADDLADPLLLDECRTLDELTRIMRLGSVYPSSWPEPGHAVGQGDVFIPVSRPVSVYI
jgi:hypothetical protein